MTTEEYLRQLIGDLVIKSAAQAAEIDTLRAKLAATEKKPE